MSLEKPFDAAVIGAGPAGSATAHALSRQGWRVALIERGRFDNPRIGESLAPNVQEPLRRLGLWEDFMSLAPIPSWGTESVWGSTSTEVHSHISNPYGSGWHVDRRAFDEMLARRAAASGASLYLGVQLKKSIFKDSVWVLTLNEACSGARRTQASSQELYARVLVDATGRTAQVARGLGAERLLFDRLIGVAGRFAGNSPGKGQEHLLVEATEAGWWYTAPLPSSPEASDSEAMIAMLMTDADLWARLQATSPWHSRLLSTHTTRTRIGALQLTSAPRVYCAQSHRLGRNIDREPGPWLAAGDATLAVDPISGSGVLRALKTASAAADTLNTILERPERWRTELRAYEAARDEECTKYLLERAAYYAVEQRFDTPFWHRRKVLSA